MATISKLPAPSSNPPALASNTVKLFKDSSWSSSSYTISVPDYTKDTRQSFSGMAMQDNATWIAFNLPVGTVVTMTNNVASVDGTVYNLKNCGAVVDLVGTGRTEAVDLTKCGLNDAISSWFWHTPDLNIGAIELFSDSDFKGNRTVIFLSEWNAGAIHSLSGWYIMDRASSARWDTLSDAQTAALFNNSDGSGSSYQNIKAWGSFKSLDNFKSVGFNDVLSSFSWNNLIPKKEVVAPINIPIAASQDTVLTTQSSGTNNSPATQTQTITYTNQTAQTTTVTVTNQYTAGMQMTYSLASKTSELVAEQTVTWSVQLSFSYSHTDTTTTTHTQTETLSISQNFNVPPQSSFNASLLVQMGTLPEGTSYTTTVDRWYDQQLIGSTLDPSNGWYKRTENITFQMGGALAVGTTLNVQTAAIG